MDDNFNDYFTDENVPEEQPQVHHETEQEREEREIKEATIERRGNTVKVMLALIIVAMVLFLAGGCGNTISIPTAQARRRAGS